MITLDRIWRTAKICTYVGAIITAICAALIGLAGVEPPDFLFSIGIGFVAIGVILGNVVVLKKARSDRNEP